ncbi:hypothetical protein BH11ARM1_BH11ARM1_17900 [soil metagenome]
MSTNLRTYTNLLELIHGRSETGPLWGTECEDLNGTFLAWADGEGVAAHVNSELDVIMAVLDGQGELVLNGESLALAAGIVIVIPKGAVREIKAHSGGIAYLNVHKRRKRLNLGNVSDRPKPIPS